MKRLSANARSALLVLLVAGAGCVDRPPPPSTTTETDGLVEINYRGQRRLAQRQGDLLLIEGDILVVPSDIWSDGDAIDNGDGTELRRSPIARRTGLGSKWPNGAVSYSLVNVTAADRQRVRDGIAMWTTAVPGLSFTELPGACTGDCLNFTSNTLSNSSPVGRVGGAQVILLQASPLPGTVAHEVAHSLGVWHEATRSDRVTFVQINWAQVRGCKSGATGFADCGSGPCQVGAGTPGQNAVSNGCCTLQQFNDGQCYMAHNFDISSASPQALMMTYDFDSIMHYGATAFSKTGAATITALVSLPPGVTMGQSSHVSVNDIASVAALYPKARVNSVLFRNTGVQGVANLDGRDQDINIRYTCTVAGVNAGQAVNTALLSEGTSTSSCTIQSPLWTLSYAYPNTTVTTWPGSGLETFSPSSTLAVLNPGLLGVFTAQW